MFRKFRKRAEISSPNLSSDENDRAKRQLFVQRSSKKARVSLNSRKSECNSVQKNKFEKKQENFYPELCLFLAERRKIWEKITWKNLDAGDRVSVASMGQILASGRRKRRRRRKQKRFPRLKCGRNERKKQRAPENRARKSVLYMIFL